MCSSDLAPPEDAWYHLAQAGRVHARHTGNNEAALRDYRNSLLAGGGIELRHEVQVFLASAERWNELGEELEAEAEAAYSGEQLRDADIATHGSPCGSILNLVDRIPQP